MGEDDEGRTAEGNELHEPTQHDSLQSASSDARVRIIGWRTFAKTVVKLLALIIANPVGVLALLFCLGWVVQWAIARFGFWWLVIGIIVASIPFQIAVLYIGDVIDDTKLPSWFDGPWAALERSRLFHLVRALVNASIFAAVVTAITMNLLGKVVGMMTDGRPPSAVLSACVVGAPLLFGLILFVSVLVFYWLEWRRTSKEERS